MLSWPFQSSFEHPNPARMAAGLGQELRDPGIPVESGLMFPLCSRLSFGPIPQPGWEPRGVSSWNPPTSGLLPPSSLSGKHG